MTAQELLNYKGGPILMQYYTDNDEQYSFTIVPEYCSEITDSGYYVDYTGNRIVAAETPAEGLIKTTICLDEKTGDWVEEEPTEEGNRDVLMKAINNAIGKSRFNRSADTSAPANSSTGTDVCYR